MTDTTTTLDLAAIKARANAATPGPWLSDPTGTVCAAADVIPDGHGGEILPEDGPMEVAECYRRETPDERARNADFIAHARQDVPALLAEVDRLAEEIARKDRYLQMAHANYGTLLAQAEDMRRALRMPDPLKPYPYPPVAVVPAETD